jgi:hypothetical protein
MMLLKFRAATWLTLFLLLSAGMALADPITNGGFDSDLTGWTYSDGVIQIDGTAQLQIQDYDLNITDIFLSQDLSISSPTASFSFDVKFDNGAARTLPDGVDPGQPNFFQASFVANSPEYDQLFLAIDATGPYDGQLNDISLPNSEGWYHFSGTITGNGTLYFDLFDRGDTAYSTAWIDNVVLTENVRAVPEPSSFLLLGSGILGFAITRFTAILRRKS